MRGLGRRNTVFRMADRIVHCSFCKKSQEEVRKVVAGPDDVSICNECIALAAELVREDPGERVKLGSRPDAS